MTTDTVVKSINETITERQIPVLGHLVWWNLENVDVLQSEVEAIIASLGYSQKEVKSICPQIEARGGLKKALEALGLRASPQAGKEVQDGGRLFYDRLLDDSTCIIMSIRERIVDGSTGQVDARYEERQQILYDRKTKTIGCANDFMKPEIEAAFLKYCKTYRAAEFRRVIQKMLEHANCINVRENGGVLFVPDMYRQVLANVHSVCNIVPGANFRSLGIVDTADTQREMARVAGEEIAAEIKAMAEELATLKERVADPEVNVRSATLQARIEAFKAVREKAHAYKDLVSLEISEIESSLNKLTAEVEALL